MVTLWGEGINDHIIFIILGQLSLKFSKSFSSLIVDNYENEEKKKKRLKKKEGICDAF